MKYKQLYHILDYAVPDLQRSRCSICYGPRAFRGPALLLRFVLLAYDQPRKYDISLQTKSHM